MHAAEKKRELGHIGRKSNEIHYERWWNGRTGYEWSRTRRLKDANLNLDLLPSSPVSLELFLFDSWRWMILMMPNWWRNKAKISKVFFPAFPNTDTESKGVELLLAIGLKSKQSDRLWAMSLITLSFASQPKLAALSRAVRMWRLSLSWRCDLSTIPGRVSLANRKAFRISSNSETNFRHSFFALLVQQLGILIL